jgi:hypothetical protein
MTFELQYGAPVHARYAGKYIFVLSHMRSFSSLLCHILGSHPAISGYGETHQSYLMKTDLERLARRVREQTGNTALRAHVLDKVLHNRHEIAPNILGRPDVKCVFLLRNAEDTLSSSVNVMQLLGRPERFTLRDMLDYYVARLAQLVRYGAQLGSSAHFVESDRLIGETDAVLADLSRWLALDEPLTSEYQTFPLTGVFGHGDPSPNIKAGRVVASAADRRQGYAPVGLPPDVLERGEAAYIACRSALSRHGGAA